MTDPAPTKPSAAQGLQVPGELLGELSNAADAMMRIACNLRREGKQRALTAAECAVLSAEERLQRKGFRWDPLASPTVSHPALNVPAPAADGAGGATARPCPTCQQAAQLFPETHDPGHPDYGQALAAEAVWRDDHAASCACPPGAAAVVPHTPRELTLAGLLKRAARHLPAGHPARQQATACLQSEGFFSVLRADDDVPSPETPRVPNFKCMDCGWVGRVDANAPACPNCTKGAAQPAAAKPPVKLVEAPARDFGQALDRFGEHLDRPEGGRGR